MFHFGIIPNIIDFRQMSLPDAGLWYKAARSGHILAVEKLYDWMVGISWLKKRGATAPHPGPGPEPEQGLEEEVVAYK